MKNIEQLLNKENWIKYLELADECGITNHGKAQDIVSKIQQAINYITCCTQLKSNETLSFEEWLSHFKKTEDGCYWLNKEILYCKEAMKLHYDGLPDE